MYDVIRCARNIELLTSQNIELPPQTKALIATSEFFSNHWAIVLGSIPAIYTLTKIALKTSDRFRYYMSAVKLKMPFIGTVVQKMEVARFCRFFTITYNSGIEILQCIKISSQVIANKFLRESLDSVKDDIESGSSLTESLEKTGHFPIIVMRLFRIGEDSGNIGETLQNVNELYDSEITNSINSMISIIKPTMTVLSGLIMGWIILSVFGPLYGSFSKM